MWAKGLVAGALTTIALLGVTYALAQAQLVSFFPLDVAQAGVRLTPGAVATQGIEALVQAQSYSPKPQASSWCW